MLYSKEIMKHFIRPQNVGKMKNYDGLGKAGNLTCGDIMYLYIKIGRDKKGIERVLDISFETFGCTIAIANTSLLTAMVKKKTLKEALKISKDDLLEKFGHVPLVKIHCSMLAVDALSEAIYDYLSKNKKPISQKLKESHQRIKREKTKVEEKYKDLVNIEEEIHKKNGSKK